MSLFAASCLLVALGGGPRQLAAGDAGTEGDFGVEIKLSPYEVTANTAEFEHWTKVSSPHFVIYTDARVNDTQGILRQMEMLHIVAQRFFGRKALVRPPMIFVLPTARSDWSRLKSTGSVEWRVAISNPESTIRELVIVQYDWQNTGLDLVWCMQGGLEMSGLGLETAFCIGRGLSNLFETAAFSKDSVKIGQQNMRSLQTRTKGWLPWKRFFAVTAKSPEFTKDNDDMRRFDGQCAVFVQFMLTNRDLFWGGRLLVWNALLAAGREPTEELFKEVFGQDWKQWQDTLAEYMDDGKYYVRVFKLPPEVLEFPVIEVALKPREMRELFVISQILNQRIPDSETALDALLARGLKADALRELLAMACLRWDRGDAALALLRKLIEEDSENPEVYTTAAGLVFDRAVPEPNINARLSSDQAGEIAAWCRKALAIEPLHPAANEGLAWAEALGPAVEAANVATIKRICRTMDGNGRTDGLITALAIARWREGNATLARKGCETLLNSLFSGEEARKIAAELLQQLDAEGPASAPSPP